MRTLSDLIGMVKAKQAEIAASLAAGNAADWESYHRMVGHHAGLQEALDVLDNLMKEENANE
jgi:ABC-type transport system involved in cytochrome c biogenesis ATPase subunit